jgi:hypothetical protein
MTTLILLCGLGALFCGGAAVLRSGFEPELVPAPRPRSHTPTERRVVRL